MYTFVLVDVHIAMKIVIVTCLRIIIVIIALLWNVMCASCLCTLSASGVTLGNFVILFIWLTAIK